MLVMVMKRPDDLAIGDEIVGFDGASYEIEDRYYLNGDLYLGFVNGKSLQLRDFDRFEPLAVWVEK